jgi:AcrR family transcriptional regulator
MQPPSLYGHFPSKNAIYDAMFAQGWEAWNLERDSMTDRPPTGQRARLMATALAYFDFAVADPERYLLMNVRTVPGFAPSANAFQPAVQSYERMRRDLLHHTQDDLDVLTALIAGLISQQLANDPGGQRWRRLLPRVISSFADDLGLPPDPHQNGATS